MIVVLPGTDRKGTPCRRKRRDPQEFRHRCRFRPALTRVLCAHGGSRKPQSSHGHWHSPRRGQVLRGPVHERWQLPERNMHLSGRMAGLRVPVLRRKSQVRRDKSSSKSECFQNLFHLPWCGRGLYSIVLECSDWETYG